MGDDVHLNPGAKIDVMQLCQELINSALSVNTGITLYKMSNNSFKNLF